MTGWQRVIRFVAQEDDQIYHGQPLLPGSEDIGLLAAKGAAIKARLLDGSPLHPHAKLTREERTVKRLLSPLARHEVRTIRGLGAQYAPAGQEASAKKPSVVSMWYKPMSTLSGPNQAIVVPRCAADEKADYEVELCVVLGKTCKNVSKDEALKCVLGYTAVNDVTSRSLFEKGGAGFAKSFDSWCPIGPVLVNAHELPDPQNVKIQTRVNGRLTQDSNTSKMIIPVAEMISMMSQSTTLEAGSIILTGSPLPLERGDNPWLKHGDKIECYVEHIGTLFNPVVEEARVSTLEAKAHL